MYCLQITSRTPALFLVQPGTNIFSILTQAHFPGKLQPILVFSFLSCLLRRALQLCFLARTRLLCKGTPSQRCSDDSRLVLQGEFVYISSLLPVPREIFKELNQTIFKFSWKGTDKVTRLSTINEYENGGLKMIDLESMIKSLRLAWLKRIFQCNNGAWRSFLRFSLEPFGGLFLFHCNYDI